MKSSKISPYTHWTKHDMMLEDWEPFVEPHKNHHLCVTERFSRLQAACNPWCAPWMPENSCLDHKFWTTSGDESTRHLVASCGGCMGCFLHVFSIRVRVQLYMWQIQACVSKRNVECIFWSGRNKKDQRIMKHQHEEMACRIFLMASSQPKHLVTLRAKPSPYGSYDLGFNHLVLLSECSVVLIQGLWYVIVSTLWFQNARHILELLSLGGIIITFRISFHILWISSPGWLERFWTFLDQVF